MDFSAFDRTEIEEMTAQAKKKWGQTTQWQEYETKTAHQTAAQLDSTGDQLMDIFRELGAVRHLSPADPQAQVLVAKLQRFITDHYYTCTKPILRSLGQMYVAGDSMTGNINRAGGDGTAQFTHEAIEIYCK